MGGVGMWWRRRDDWAPVWAARAVFLVGLVTVLSAATPALRGRLDLVLEVLPTFAPRVARVGTVTIGLALLMLASGLRRRKRRAWLLATVLAGVVALLHLVKGLDVEEGLLSLGVLVLLLDTRRAFTGRPDPRSWRHAVAVLVGGTVAAVGVGTAFALLDRDEVPGHPALGSVVASVLAGMVGLPGYVPLRPPGQGTELAVVLILLGGVVLASSIAAMLRPASGPRPMDADAARRLRELLRRRADGDSLGYFALRRDKCVVFSPSGKAAVAYRVVGGVTLAAGDPLGDPEAWPGAIRAWLDQGEQYAWTPAVLGASERGADAYHRFGLDAWEVGDEAVLETSRFCLDGRAMRTVRQAVNRVERQGHTVAVGLVGDLSARELAEAAAAMHRWRDAATERGFAMALGRFGEEADDGCVLVRARDADGTLVGLLHFVPWGEDGLSLDVMRRDPGSTNGVVELMVVRLVAYATSRRLCRVSMNFAVFRSVFERGERIGAGPVLRLWRHVLVGASRFWQIESLYRANAKFQPEWVPRFLCFRAARDVPRVTLAALQAEAFLVRPRLTRRRPAAARPNAVTTAGRAPATRAERGPAR